MRRSELFQLFFEMSFLFFFYSNFKIRCTQKHNFDINDYEFVSFCSCWSLHHGTVSRLADDKSSSFKFYFPSSWRWMPYVQIISLLLCSSPSTHVFQCSTFNIMFFQCLFIFRYFCLCYGFFLYDFFFVLFDSIHIFRMLFSNKFGRRPI